MNFSRCPKSLLSTMWAFILCFVTPALSEDILVTGTPASRAFLTEVLVSRGSQGTPPRPLRPGEKWQTPDGTTIFNLDWRPPGPVLVALSDHPEKVEWPGGLFFGGLTPGRRLNFQYYHLGKLKGRSPNLTLFVTNPGPRDATVHTVRGIGRPSLDYFSSGHTNNVEWFRALESNHGEFFSIPSGQTISILRQELPPEMVVSGTLGLTQVDGSPLQFALVAQRDDEVPLALNNLLKNDDVHSRGFYPAPTQVIERTFEIGDPPLNIAVGAVRQQTFSGVRELRGDYGVTYQLSLHLKNPTNEKRVVEVLFNPRGGAATGTFTWNGKLVEVPLTKAFAEQSLGHLTLDPHSEELLELHTIPEGASSYPVRIVIKG